MRRAAALLAATLALGACGGTGITAAKVAASVQRSFANTYAAELRELGRPASSAAGVRAVATCGRSTPGVAADSAGDDWFCVVTFLAADGTPQSARYETKVRTNGCWTVTGPAAVLGAPVLENVDGRAVTNRLLEMDGCFAL